ncbi:hypothetical protein DUI87_03743 [Hirundo rustica rustica]|uniref:Peptidase A2 domain-containing protein n=1 Tax=Hirundo rustica rustica TaxID=333673 RepID=A0A3M0L0W5_HIRRU|nr:hypothetical protein DUI87_03743 [Hirundo rustica rustica]
MQPPVSFDREWVTVHCLFCRTTVMYPMESGDVEFPTLAPRPGLEAAALAASTPALPADVAVWGGDAAEGRVLPGRLPPCQVTILPKDNGLFWGEVKAKTEGLNDDADAGAGPAGATHNPVNPWLSRLAGGICGSAGVDVCTAESLVIDSEKIHKVPLDAFGPLGDGMSAFLMGRSSATIQGIMGHLGLIDADFSGQIHAMVSTPTPPLTIPKGTQIVQLVPFKSSVSRTEDRSRGDSGFSSTGPPQVRWTAVLTKDRPETLCTVSMVGATPSEIHLRGLLDTEADVSILSLDAWPPQWTLSLAKTSIVGLGGMKQCYVSRNPMTNTNPEGQTA